MNIMTIVVNKYKYLKTQIGNFKIQQIKPNKYKNNNNN